jgi:hypothetical protein
LNAEQIPAFRVYLEESGLLVRDSGAGQFFHVRLPELPRWLPIERGRAGAPVTPDVLRPFVASFLKKPLDSAIGDVRAVRYAAERAVARAALALPVSVAPALESIPLIDPQLSPAPTDDAQYLSDLRDDFALHAPIPLPALFTQEQFERHVKGRWAYADLMMAARTTKAGD